MIPHNRGVTATATLPSLDGRRFRMVSSTTSAVDGESELELTDDGRIRLVEHYEMHGLPQLSVVEEIVAR